MGYANLTKIPKLALMTFLACGLCIMMSARVAGQSAEDRLLEILASEASVADKCNACRDLQTAGTERSVPILAALLTDPAVSHTARMALEVMPYASAGAALRDAVGQTSGLVKSGMIDSVGERRDAEAVTILADSLPDEEPQVRAAAAAALGKIGAPAAAAALSAAHARAQGDDRATLGQALVQCADGIREAGERDAAVAIFVRLLQPTESELVRASAFRGYLRAAESDQEQRIVEALDNDAMWMRQTAAGRLPHLTDGAFRGVAANIADLSSDAQVAVLAAMRLRCDKTLTPVVLKMAEGTDTAVRVAAIQTLGIVGDVSATPLLFEAVAGDDEVGVAARQSLEIICDPRVDQRIAERLTSEADPSRRIAWIGLVEARRCTGAVSLLLNESTHGHPEVRSRAMDALANLAGPKQVAAMTTAVLHAEKGAERDNAEKAVMLVCQQNPDADRRADPVIDVIEESVPADRAALLPLLGRIGGSDAKRKIDAALLDSGDAEMYEAAVRAICNWPDASVSGQLLELSETADSATHRLWALRAFIRVIALPSDIPDADKLAMLKQAIGRAQRDDERNLVLQRASAVRTVDSLRFLLPYLDQPSLAQTAGASIVELARHKELRDPNRAEFIQALERVLETNQDENVLEQSRRSLQAAKGL